MPTVSLLESFQPMQSPVLPPGEVHPGHAMLTTPFRGGMLASLSAGAFMRFGQQLRGKGGARIERLAAVVVITVHRSRAEPGRGERDAVVLRRTCAEERFITQLRAALRRSGLQGGRRRAIRLFAGL